MKAWSTFLLFAVLAPFAHAGMDEQQVLTSIRHHLERHYSADGQWQIEFVRALDIPEATDAVVVAGVPSMPANSMIVRLQLYGAGVMLLEANVAIRASLWRNAWVAREPLTRGQGVDPRQLEAQRLDMLREPTAVPAEATQEGDYIYARSIPAGRVLNWRDLERRPIVQRGEMVEVAAVDGALSVVLKGMALEDGALGELIRIRNMQSHREIAALVVREGRAEIRF